MLWLILWGRLRVFALLACLFLFLCGCQPKNTVWQSPISSEEEADYACSYAYFLWGRHAELLLRFDEALEFYQKVLICDERAEFASEKIPVLLLRLDRIDEAALWLHDFLSTHQDRIGMRMLYATVLLRQGKNTEAMDQYQLVSDQKPDDPAILLLLAEMYLSTEQPERARPFLEQLLAQDQLAYSAHILMARLCQLQGRIDEAVVHYQSALNRHSSVELQMELGEIYVRSERYNDAVALYEGILENDDQNKNARVALIHVYLLQQRDAPAMLELNRLKRFAEQPWQVDLIMARLHAKQQEYDIAIAITQKILKKENLPEARYFFAVLLAQQSEYDRALQQARLIDSTASNYLDGLFLQVRILNEQNKLEEARLLLEKHIGTEDLRNAAMYTMLAAFHQLEGREDLSKKVMLQGLDFFPDDETLLYEYGLLLEDSGEQGAALAIMQKIIALAPDNAAALNFVGFSWADEEINLDQALEYIQRAIELQPDNGYIRDSLGWVYYRLGKFALAIKELERAAKLSPEDATILEHLGDVYLESGRMREALQAYKKAIQFFIRDEKAKATLIEKVRLLEKQRGR